MVMKKIIFIEALPIFPQSKQDNGGITL